MSWKLKTLGPALAAALMLAAVGAAGAQAEEADFAASKYPVEGEVIGDGNVAASSPIGVSTCLDLEESPPLHGSGTLLEQTNELQTSSVIGVTNCHATVLKLPMTVDTNGCVFQAEAGTMLSSTTAEGGGELLCPEGKTITTTIFANSTQHAAKNPGCVTHVASQRPDSGTILYHNIEDESGQRLVTVEGSNVTLTSTRTAGSLCTAGEDVTVTYNGAFIVRGSEGIDVEVTGTP